MGKAMLIQAAVRRSDKIVLVGMVAILTAGVVGAYAIEPAAGLQSVVINLGLRSDFDRMGKVFLPNSTAWRMVGTRERISYRELKVKASANVFFAAFDVDKDGFCKHDMILEVFYRDDIKQWTDKNRVQGTAVIKSRIDFAKDNEYVEVGHLQAIGDGKWKIARIFLERTPRQTVRAIDGSFQFKIVTPKSKVCTIPISYIKLSSVTHSDLVTLREKERSQRRLQRVEYKPVSGKRRFLGQAKAGFVVYPVDYLELVFPNSCVDHDRLNEPLQCFEVAGRVEPVTFVIHAYEDLKNVRVVVSDLHGASASIPSENVDIRRVEYNDQRWGWMTERHYGTCPDYLSFEDPVVDIKAHSNCQFWLTINVPETTAAGFYEGEVEIYTNNKQIQTIPLLVEVLPIKLLANRVKHMIYHSPYLKNFHRDPIKVLQDMKKHGLTPILYPYADAIKIDNGLDVRLHSFECQLSELRKVYPDAKELFIALENYYHVWRGLGGGKPVFTRPFANFEATYGKVLKRYAELAKRYGFELYFSFRDEPFKRLEPRRASYLCSRIAQANGLKTWSTHRLSVDVQLPLTGLELSTGVNYLRPLREVLDIFVEAVVRVDENSIRTLQKSRSDLSYYTTYLATGVRPVYNRILLGIYPFVTNSRFVVCYAYRDALVDPYDDMDFRANYPHIVGMNDYLLTYPTWQGAILPTLSYEALREGVEDSQLISTALILAQRASRSGDPNTVHLGNSTKQYLNSIICRLDKNFRLNYWGKSKPSPVDPMERAILKDLNEGKSEDYGVFDKIRRGVCDRIITLQNVLNN